ncbi:MAG TPA: carbohydrate-binding module family 20 domain-containing protein, partial [Puia sp.]|nr:carbohydrate-binding module family 20 domain-containing protein [Puia sp.]
MQLKVKIEFYLRFYTRVGQSLYISGNTAALGMDDPEKALPMQYMNAEFWHGSLEIPDDLDGPLRYHYLLCNEDGTVTTEWGDDRVVCSNEPGIEEI